MSGLIKKNDATEAMLQLERDDEESYGASIPEGFDGARAVEALNKLPVVEPLTYAEKMRLPQYTTITTDFLILRPTARQSLTV